MLIIWTSLNFSFLQRFGRSNFAVDNTYRVNPFLTIFGFHSSTKECFRKHSGKKEIMLIISIFSFSHNFLFPRAPDKSESHNFMMQKKSQILSQTLCCLYSLESSQRDDSNEYQQHRV